MPLVSTSITACVRKCHIKHQVGYTGRTRYGQPSRIWPCWKNVLQDNAFPSRAVNTGSVNRDLLFIVDIYRRTVILAFSIWLDGTHTKITATRQQKDSLGLRRRGV